MPNVMKIRPEGAELFHADGRTDRQIDRPDEIISRFSQFCESASKPISYCAIKNNSNKHVSALHL